MARARRGRHEGGCFQRSSDGLWVASKSCGTDPQTGKRVRLTAYGTTKGDALQRLDELKAAAKGGLLPRAGAVTVGEFARSWLDGREPDLEPTTHAQYAGHITNHILPGLGALKLKDLDPGRVAGFLTRMTQNGVKPPTARKVLVTLRAVLKAAVAADIIPKNPAARVPLPRHTRPPVAVPDPDQVRAFLAAAEGDRLGPLFPVAIDSGLRQGELWALLWTDYNPSTGALTVTKSLAELKGKLWVKPVKTVNSRRLVVLSFAKPHLDAHREKMRAEGRDVTAGLIFCDTEGKFLRKSNFHRRTFRPITKKAGLAFTFHGQRHGMASLMLLAGVDPTVVSRRLGHGSVSFTANVYQHVLAGVQEQAAAKLAAVLHPPPPAEIGYSQATEAPKPPAEKQPRKRRNPR